MAPWLKRTGVWISRTHASLVYNSSLRCRDGLVKLVSETGHIGELWAQLRESASVNKVEEEWFQMILGISFGPLMHILTHFASSHIGPPRREHTYRHTLIPETHTHEKCGRGQSIAKKVNKSRPQVSNEKQAWSFPLSPRDSKQTRQSGPLCFGG